MPDFAYRTEATVDAAPKMLFDIVSDLSTHVELAGSGELKTVTQKPVGDVETGTRFLAEESVKLADGSGMDVTADSVVVVCDQPTTFSWIANPLLADRLRRVQWWFHFTPEGDGTRVVHEVELDFGDLQDEMLKGLRDNFEQVRAPVIRAGMDRTLENLKSMADAVAPPLRSVAQSIDRLLCCRVRDGPPLRALPGVARAVGRLARSPLRFGASRRRDLTTTGARRSFAGRKV